MTSIAIIGAGAAGLMCAARLLETLEDASAYHIDIFEKNSAPGKKILLTGGGRCNVTTSISDKKVLAKNYVRGWDFIKKPMGKFGPKKVWKWFESHGVPLKIEANNRVFPISNKGEDIVGVFEDTLARYRESVTLHTNTSIVRVESLSQKEYTRFRLHTEHHTLLFDILVIATGGSAYSATGSTGDGYAFAQALGHTLTPLGPSLGSFLVQESWIACLAGLSLEKARITTSLQQKETRSLEGRLLFTHTGISGPLAFMLSAHIAWMPVSRENTQHISLIPKSDWNKEVWNSALEKACRTNPKKYIKNIVGYFLPEKLAQILLSSFFPHIETKFAGNISAKERKHLCEFLANGIPLTLVARRQGEEFVSAGGVDTKDISSQTCESKIFPGLYFGGEILNVDGYTGGFSLQICWASGATIAEDIAQKIIEKKGGHTEFPKV